MLSFFSDIILLVLPLLNSFWFIFTTIVLVFNFSKWKKNALRGLMILSSITAPFNAFFLFTPIEENISSFSEFLHLSMLTYSGYLLVFSFLIGILAALRLHVFGGKSNASAKASGRIHQWSFRDFFRRRWRLIFYCFALGFWVTSIVSIGFYLENWSDFHTTIEAQ